MYKYLSVVCFFLTTGCCGCYGPHKQKTFLFDKDFVKFWAPADSGSMYVLAEEGSLAAPDTFFVGRVTHLNKLEFTEVPCDGDYEETVEYTLNPRMGGETLTSGAYARSSGARGTLKGKIGTTHIWFYPSQSNDYPITTRKDSNNYFNDSLQIGPTTFQHVWANFNNFDVSGYYTKNKAALYLAKDVGIVGFRIFDPSKNDYRIFYLKESKIIPRKE